MATKTVATKKAVNSKTPAMRTTLTVAQLKVISTLMNVKFDQKTSKSQLVLNIENRSTQTIAKVGTIFKGEY